MLKAILTIGLTPSTTLLDLRQDVSVSLPSHLHSGEVLTLSFAEANFLFADGKSATEISPGQVLLAPDETSNHSWTNISYRKLSDNKLHWWTRSIPVRTPQSSNTFRMPASLPRESFEDYHREMLSKLSKDIKGALRSPCFEKPLNSIITSNFGEPRILPDGKFYRHTGVDQRAHIGVPVKAVSDGQIIYADEMPVTGKMVVIDHGAGVTSRYMHLSQYKIPVGLKVRRGFVIGLSGNSGRSLAPHLHWELSWRGTSLDPLRFLQKMAPICGRG